ncbi:acyl-coenzyme A synthetase/AMP-(fatty) acid ligase [Enterococcus rotai]|uniref:AMP-dependent synthetase/ligase domain-containing protein n=1 Tax=Enterococcus rotai TaxID=118060 RepID=A0A0U2WVL8_9ENTE|nr:class I adenylate-forming enzyme family protein [Enterococcus rotai]ALS36074.1 hypothetical protein ATZ35_02525 [Enterococcus rotai]
MYKYLKKNKNREPDKEIIKHGEKSITNKELLLKVNQFVNYFNNFPENGKILLISEDRFLETPLIIASIISGKTISIISNQTESSIIESIVNIYAPDLIISSRMLNYQYISLNTIYAEVSFHSNVLEYGTEINENSIPLIIFTSGSTDVPKGVQCSWKSIKFCIEEISILIGLNSEDRIGLFLPLFFDYGLYHLFFSIFKNCSIIFIDKTYIGTNLITDIIDNKISILPSTPVITQFLINRLKKSNLNSNFPLKKITNTGEELDPKAYDKLKEILPNCSIYFMYGVTECKRVAILNPSDFKFKRGSVGKSLPNVNTWIKDSQGKLHHNNATGELIVEGPNVMNGYLNEDDSFYISRGKRFFATGDIFYKDEHNYLFFKERNKNYIKKNGVRIGLNLLENLYKNFFSNPELVIEFINNEIVLFIVSNQTIKDLRHIILYNTSPNHKADRVIKVENIPLLANGKVDRHKIKEMAR